MHLNREKCVFGVPTSKFLGFMLTARGIEANPDKCATIVEMRSPKNLKEIQRLVGRLTSLARLLPKLTEGRGPRSRPKRGLSPSVQVQHASQPWEMRVQSVGRQIPGVHVDRPRYRGQSWQVRRNCRDEKSQKSEGDPTVGRASDIPCALPA